MIGYDPAYGRDKAMLCSVDKNNVMTLIDPADFGATTQEEIQGVIELLELINPCV